MMGGGGGCARKVLSGVVFFIFFLKKIILSGSDLVGWLIYIFKWKVSYFYTKCSRGRSVGGGGGARV